MTYVTCAKCGYDHAFRTPPVTIPAGHRGTLHGWAYCARCDHKMTFTCEIDKPISPMN